MGKMVEKKRKKKGRPSLLDLQKRNLKQQQEEQQTQRHKRDNSAPSLSRSHDPAAPRRSTRRNPIPDAPSPGKTDDDEEDDGEFSGKRREKKLKLVLKLPAAGQEGSPPGAGATGPAESSAEEDGSQRKRKMREIGDVSGAADGEKGEKPLSGSKTTANHQGTQMDSGPSTPLPDKKLLVFILERLQKKDTYGVFSEPVDPKELPDYHEVIEHPMDFGTVRKKLAGGAYANLEQFEKDVFLICSNAMQYNAPDTIYFRQARAIQELANKNFENLRQDSDDNEPEQKVVRRGRPPTKNLKRPVGRPPLDRAGSEFSSDATLATGGENTTPSTYDLRKGPSYAGKYGPINLSGRLHYGSRNNDIYASPFLEKRHDRNDEYAGLLYKGSSAKHDRKQAISTENRRNTYSQFPPSACGHEPSVLTTFSKERKQLMAVGLHPDHSYARSLARFAANLGPVAWKVASKRIERSLPAGVKFGPGWVGENDISPQRRVLGPFSAPASLSPKAVQCGTELKVNLLEKQQRASLPETAVPSTESAEVQLDKVENTEGLNSASEPNALKSGSSLNVLRPPFQIPQSCTGLGINGINGVSKINLAAHMGKLIGVARADGFNFQSPRLLDPSSRSGTNSIAPGSAQNLNVEDPRTPGETAGLHRSPPSNESSQHKTNSELLQQQRPGSLPPDLNFGFQSPSSPASGKPETEKPDLALQL
ncbi:uncharacterized protein LOC115756846 [Rhodamnia argentea]|uniref:Uncharacterized protein LOC115756846 n=1 Tax=Rhodamnia argentea TaxID=178133 RepID=A0A8B8QZP3_9MYRT|nr:uncharacterized protein LOC115756846 [Rhodamnia argentea]